MMVSTRLLEICSNEIRFSALSGQIQAISVTLETESDVNRFLNVKTKQSAKDIVQKRYFYVSTKNPGMQSLVKLTLTGLT